ncbi:MAG: carbamoyltransferase HypF [Anaerolineales bacterium]|nr:carbamoyltransferase HypF [Anaerolineales bacterium]
MARPKRGVKIHIGGVVQGVGFRPFVYNLASTLRLTGWVKNTSAGVDIEADGDEETLQIFLQKLRDDAPSLSRVDDFSAAFGPANGFAQFDIIRSQSVDGAFQPISPDVAVCDDCLRELFNPADRRYRYPFINCTNCGPRFTIIQDIPYDRPQTTMANFELCPDCAREYKDPSDRRFHAQPVACPACGPQISFERLGAEKSFVADEALQETRNALRNGEILAVKGLGGFHLACDATNAAAVSKLRARKLRADKPFALMAPDLQTIERHCFVSEAERELLTSSARPIVLLRKRPESNIAEEVAPKQTWLGVMLPYTPLHYLLFLDSLKPLSSVLPPLVMTSGNLSEEPIATGNDEARQRLARLADAFLMHNRDIHIRCDDSVVRTFERSNLSTFKSSSIYPLRRSRGYSPFPVKLPFRVPQILATGAELKNAFCVTHENYAFLSHHIGDMENYETLKSFEQGVAHFERLFRVKPEALAHDMHPNYLATRCALERAERENIPALAVQHHHAHIAACMAERGLNEPVVGVSFDGTGYGEDGAIWGGEFLVADYRAFQRAAHLTYFPLAGGDAAIKKPARTALALLWSLGLEWDDALESVREFCAEDLTTLKIQLEKRINTPPTSSMGRLFDAAAALAGARQTVNYEGQAAIEFEALADSTEAQKYLFGVEKGQIEVRGAIENLIQDCLAGVSISKISARFHNGVAEMTRETVAQIRRETAIQKVVLSGGVWQNLFLLRQTVSLLEKDGADVFIHREVPTNDGGLSLGQAAIAAARLRG